MYVKVEPTGCCEREGYVQVRFDFFLNEGDVGYSSKYVQVPERGMTQAEIDSGSKVVIPLIWQLTPFHTHFDYFKPTDTTAYIMDRGAALLDEAYAKWSSGAKIDIRNAPILAVSKTAKRINDCVAKVASIQSAELVRIKG